MTPEQLEAVNEVMKTSLGGTGDGVQNADRVMRLAGTVSYPPPHKVERGYVPEVTKLNVNANPRAYHPDELIGLLTSKPEPYLAHNRKGGAARGHRSSSNASGGERKPGRTDAELEALLESSRKSGNWHNAIPTAIATMIGRGWSDSAIRLTCEPYCEDSFGDETSMILSTGGVRSGRSPASNSTPTHRATNTANRATNRTTDESRATGPRSRSRATSGSPTRLPSPGIADDQGQPAPVADDQPYPANADRRQSAVLSSRRRTGAADHPHSESGTRSADQNGATETHLLGLHARHHVPSCALDAIRREEERNGSRRWRP